MKFLLGGLIVTIGGLVVYGAISGHLAQMMGAIVGIGAQTSGTSKGKSKIPGNPFSPGNILGDILPFERIGHDLGL